MNMTVSPDSASLYSAYPVTIEAYTQSEDERKIRKVFEELSEAWNVGDAKRFASLFTEDCDYITFRRDHIEGRKNNEKVHNDLFRTFLKNTILVSEVKKINFISNDVAIAYCLGLVKSQWSRRSTKDKLNTNVLVKTNDEWKIKAFHNCKIKKAGIVEKVLSFFIK
jgi:uncharacterized protein (TIGR02246 family)